MEKGHLLCSLSLHAHKRHLMRQTIRGVSLQLLQQSINSRNSTNQALYAAFSRCATYLRQQCFNPFVGDIHCALRFFLILLLGIFVKLFPTKMRHIQTI
jgi:hypothetical protein